MWFTVSKISWKPLGFSVGLHDLPSCGDLPLASGVLERSRFRGPMVSRGALGRSQAAVDTGGSTV